MRRFLNILIILFTTFTFFSCSNLIGNDVTDSETFINTGSSKVYTIQGKITLEELTGAVPRTAFPAQPEGTIYYRITAKCEEETVTSEKNSTDSNFTLKIPHAGNWIVSAEGFKETTHTNLILKTSENKILQISDSAPMGYANLVLKPYVSENGKGNVSLRINLPDPATSPRPISSVTIGGIDSSVGITASVTGNQADIKGNNIKSGSYTVEISFWGDLNNDSISDILYYHVTEVINVYDNLTTNAWVKHGDEPYIKDDGTFEITDAMIEDFMFSTVYVGGEGKDDANTGTFLSPVATLTKAFSIPNAKNFYITGEVTAGSDFTVNQNGFLRKHPSAATAKILVTHTDSSLILVNASKTFEISNVTITGPGSSSLRSQAGIVNNGDLTLNNCVISEFYRSNGEQNGGAIYNSAGTLTINGGKISNCGAFNGGAVCNLATCNINGVEFSQNKATGTGGGAIANSASGKVSISGYGTTNTLFIKNESTADEKMIGDYDNGGGAILNAGELELENCQFYENSVRFGVGGAIYNMTNTSSTKICKTDNSGTSLVVIGKTRQPNFVTASDSTGNSKGGAIYNKGVLNMYKGTCIGNTDVRDVPTSIGSAANYAHEGGGVYNAGTFKIAGGEIKGNLAERKQITHPVGGTKWVNGIGSGIYCATGSTVSFDGGLITYNSTYTTPSPAAYAVKGSGIYVAGSLDMSGNATVADNNDIYLVTGKTIKLQNALTATGTAATITPQYYNLDASGNEVDPIQLLAESTTGLIAGNYKKFKVTGYETGWWRINSDGKLEEGFVVNNLTLNATKLADSLEEEDEVFVNLKSNFSVQPPSSYDKGSFEGAKYALQIPAGKKLIIKGASPGTVLSPSVRCGTFFKVEGELVLENVTISPGSSSIHWSVFEIKSGGSVTMNEGSKITDFSYNGSVDGIVTLAGGNFTMNGGEISNNGVRGAVLVNSSRSIFTMNGGAIKNNNRSSSPDPCSGGVTVNSGTFIKTGGTITENTSEAYPEYNQVFMKSGSKFGTSVDSVSTVEANRGYETSF